jgi:hypothetical protein
VRHALPKQCDADGLGRVCSRRGSSRKKGAMARSVERGHGAAGSAFVLVYKQRPAGPGNSECPANRRRHLTRAIATIGLGLNAIGAELLIVFTLGKLGSYANGIGISYSFHDNVGRVPRHRDPRDWLPVPDLGCLAPAIADAAAPLPARAANHTNVSGRACAARAPSPCVPRGAA